MAGHSKWKNIREKKGKTDAKRGKIFTKLAREIMVAVKEGGGADPAANARLREVIAKAKVQNLPNDNIKRAIEKAASGGEGANFEQNTYEGYGPAGVAVIVETMTDNRNRTAGEVRHYFDKCGGNLGAAGCVSWSFDRLGVFVIERMGQAEDTVMLDAIEAGAADFIAEEEVFVVHTAPECFAAVYVALTAQGYAFLSAEVEMVPQTHQALGEDEAKKMQKMLDMFEDNDDVQNVWHNWEV